MNHRFFLSDFEGIKYWAIHSKLISSLFTLQIQRLVIYQHFASSFGIGLGVLIIRNFINNWFDRFNPSPQLDSFSSP